MGSLVPLYGTALLGVRVLLHIQHEALLKPQRCFLTSVSSSKN